MSDLPTIIAKLRKCDTPLDQEVVSLIERMHGALLQCEDYFDGRSDVADGSYGEPHPNAEMQLLTEVRQALGTS